MNASSSLRKCARTRPAPSLPLLPAHKLAAIIPAAALLLLGNLSAIPQPDLLSFASAGSLTGWTTYGSVVTANSAQSITLGSTPYTIAPAASTYLARITTSGSTAT